jgi:hypothetical protein
VTEALLKEFTLLKGLTYKWYMYLTFVEASEGTTSPGSATTESSSTLVSICPVPNQRPGFVVSHTLSSSQSVSGEDTLPASSPGGESHSLSWNASSVSSSSSKGSSVRFRSG